MIIAIDFGSRFQVKMRCIMRRFTLVLVAIIAVLSALATTQAGEFYTKHKGDKRRAEPAADMALVYVFRPASMGAAIKTWTFADDQLIGVSRAKGYYFEQVPAGKHVIWSKAENTSAMELELEAGETYYFKTAIRLGLGKARVALVQIDPIQAEKFFKKCSYCEPTGEGIRIWIEKVLLCLESIGKEFLFQLWLFLQYHPS